MKKDLIAIGFIIVLGLWIASSYVDFSSAATHSAVAEMIVNK